MNIKVVNNSSNSLPEYKTLGSACVDLMSNEDIVISPRSVRLIPTGLFLEIPVGYELQIRPRSGTFLKKECFIPNSPGTIDSDYRGEVMVQMYNMSDVKVLFMRGTRIAQAALSPVIPIVWAPVDTVEELSQTQRGTGGFGHTG